MASSVIPALPRTTIITAVLTLVLTVLATALSGCVSPGSSARQAAVTREAVVFEPGTIPRELLEAVTVSNVTLLGETHYVQEHQTLLVDLAAAVNAHDPRPLVILQEGEHALSWLVEDYVNGRRHDYPPSITALDGGVIEGLRRMNRGTPEESKVTYRYFDMNHWIDSAQVSLRVMALELGISPLVAEFVAADPTGDAYGTALNALADRVIRQQTELTGEIGEHWYQRLIEVIEIEQRSLPLRRRTHRSTSRHQRREEILIELALREMTFGHDPGHDRDPEQNPRVLINTGMFHAQLEPVMGTRHTWLGEFLAQHPEYTGGRQKLFSLAVFGLRGERIYRFYEPDPVPIPTPQERSRFNLVRDIDAVAHARAPTTDGPGAVFLDLSDAAFSRPARIAFTHRREYRTRLNRQFDAYLVFPEITVTETLLQRDD